MKIAIAAYALTLPPSAVGLMLIRLGADVRSIRRSQTATQAAHDAGLQVQDSAVSDRQAGARRRNALIFRCLLGLLIAIVVLTLVGLVATLWHNAWWIAAAFLAILALSLSTLLVAAVQLGGGGSVRRHAARGESEPHTR